MNNPCVEAAAEFSNPVRHWYASLELSFAKAHGRTELVHSRHRGPLRVQRLFHPGAGDTAHCYLLHPPGGVALGDELHIDVTLSEGSALLTTPSAGRFYSVGGHPEAQWQRVRLQVDEGRLAWLPQETILFSGANTRLDTRIELGRDAQLVYWDVLVLGRPACGDRFSEGRVEQYLEVARCGRPMLCERLAMDAGDRLSESKIGLGGSSTVGIMVVTGEAPGEAIDGWLQDVNGGSEGPFTLTQRDGLSIARYLGEDAGSCRRGFTLLWQLLERASTGESPDIPRVWHT